MDQSTIVSQISHVPEDEPKLSADLPWWEALDNDYHKQRIKFNLQRRDRRRVRRTARIDNVIVKGAATAVAACAVPFGFNPRTLARHYSYASHYKSLLNPDNPHELFVQPPNDVKVTHSRSRYPIFRPKTGTVEDLSFISPYRTLHPEMQAEYGRFERNKVAHARLWRHGDRPRPTIIAIHGFGVDNRWLNEWLFSIRWFYEEFGCDVMLFTLPFHGPRQPRYSIFSGQRFFGGGIANVNEAFAQAVFDFRIFMTYLERSLGVRKMGVTGISLGGYTAALLAAIEPRLQFAIPNVPVLSLADTALEWRPIDLLVKPTMQLMGLTVADLREYLAIVTPLSYRPIIPTDNLMVIGGVGDRLAPPKHARLLWEHWDNCRLHWFPGSHILHLDRGAFFSQIARFLTEIHFLD